MTDTLPTETHREHRTLWGARTSRVSPGTLWGLPRPLPDTHGTGDHGHTTPPVAQARAQIVVRRIYCSCTTEAGHDEVYYLFGGVNGAGARVSHRGPDAWQSADADNATAWDMNDSGDEQNRYLNATIYDEALLPGQTATFASAFYESDQQDYGSTVAAAGKLASGVGTVLGQPVVKIAGLVLTWIGSLIPKNQDDFLGAFSLRLANNGGKVSIADLATGTYARLISWNKATNQFTLGFRHDDGDYTVDFQVVGR